MMSKQPRLLTPRRLKWAFRLLYSDFEDFARFQCVEGEALKLVEQRLEQFRELDNLLAQPPAPLAERERLIGRLQMVRESVRRARLATTAEELWAEELASSVLSDAMHALDEALEALRAAPTAPAGEEP